MPLPDLRIAIAGLQCLFLWDTGSRCLLIVEWIGPINPRDCRFAKPSAISFSETLCYAMFNLLPDCRLMVVGRCERGCGIETGCSCGDANGHAMGSGSHTCSAHLASFAFVG